MSFRSQFPYRYKKWFAISFSVLGIGLYMSYIIAEAISGYLTSPLSIISVIITIFAYTMILTGNIQARDYAYNGIMMFIFWSTFSFILGFITQMGNMVSSLYGGHPELIVLSVFTFLFYGGAIATGILSYIRIRQYLTSRYSNYERLRNWMLAFTICMVLSSAVYPALILYTYHLYGETLDAVTFFVSLAPYLSDICIAIASYFTVLRLRSNF